MAETKYKEPDDFFPEELLKKFKVGAYAEDTEEETQERDKTNEKIRDFVNNKK